MSEILAIATGTAVRVRTPHAAELAQRIAGGDVTVTSTEGDLLQVVGLTSAQIGEAAVQAGIVLHELTPLAASLEDAYLELTQDDVEYHSEVSR